MTDRYLVISSDCHAGLPPEQYRDYLDPKHRDTFDVALPIQLEMTRKAAKKFLVDEINEEWRKGLEPALTGAWDSDARNRVLENELRLLKEDPVYVEGVARRLFRKSKEGEVIYKIVPAEEIPPGAETAPRTRG